MSQIEEFRKTGNWLFRRRSFIPLCTVVLFLIAFRHFTLPQNTYPLNKTWEMLCFSVSLLGFGIRVYTVGHTPRGTSNRSTKTLKANVLNTTGMYSIVRHPLYLGNFLIWLGISMFLRSLFFSLTCIALFLLYYERIIFVEEEFLCEKFGDEFPEWASRTPMIIPNFKYWKKPDIPFSLKTVLKREYSGFFAIIASFTAMEILGNSSHKDKWEFEWICVIIFSIGLFTYLALRFLKKKKILNVEGR